MERILHDCNEDSQATRPYSTHAVLYDPIVLSRPIYLTWSYAPCFANAHSSVASPL